MRIEQFKRPIGPGQHPHRTDYLQEEPASVEEAQELIEQYIGHFHQHGFNEEHGYWWGRNVGDLETTILVIEHDIV